MGTQWRQVVETGESFIRNPDRWVRFGDLPAICKVGGSHQTDQLLKSAGEEAVVVVCYGLDE